MVQQEPYKVSDLRFQCKRDTPQVWEGFDQHYELEINFVESGSFTLLHGGSLVTLSEGEGVAFWAARPHQIIEVAPETWFFYLHIPLCWFLEWAVPSCFRADVLEGKILRADLSGSLPLEKALFLRWDKDLLLGSPPLLEVVKAETQAWLYRFSLRVSCRDLAKENHAISAHDSALPANNKVVQMVRYIAENYLEPILVKDVAAAVHVNPNYASTVFKQHGGVTIMEYVTQLRVSHAQLLLATTNENVTDIVYESGFGSASQFYKAFRHSCGQSPGSYRTQIRASTRAGNG